MKQILIKQGQVTVEEIPAPCVEPGTVLIRVDRSCISVGTEMSGIKSSGMPLWKRAMAQPKNVEKVLRMAMTQGASSTRSLVQSKVSAAQPTGYSAAGIVMELGEGVVDFNLGDRVACAGTQCAYHAEIVRVPVNLVLPIPNTLEASEASTVALGAIALQGVRRAEPTLGESFVVIGLGVVGQLTTQILKTNGCRVIGTDLDQKRIDLAIEMGIDVGLQPSEMDEIEQVIRLTDGIGADGIIITAASPSDAIVETAFKMCRKKGRVVVIGEVGLNLKRSEIYYKELDFFISSSYGPGRYDNVYEEKGLDYPVAFVRWTENRNMAEYLRLLAEGKVKVSPLISGTYSIEQAPTVYSTLQSGGTFPPICLLNYPRNQQDVPPIRLISNPSAHPAGKSQIQLAVVGTGEFAKTVHLPNLRALSKLFHIRTAVSRSGHNASSVAKQFSADYASTDFQEVLEDPEIDAVLIATRHNLHAAMALKALASGKHVFVEKPLALTRDDLEKIKIFFAKSDKAEQKPILFTGFNRRFSKYAHHILKLVNDRNNPMVVNYRVNAGFTAPDHWTQTEEGGKRNLGEACHIYDLFTYLTGSYSKKVSVHAIQPHTKYYAHHDNFITTISFEDGSIATLTYTSMGSDKHPKEQMEIFVDGTVIMLDNFRKMIVSGRKKKGLKTPLIEKGHKEELEAFGMAIRDGGEWPILLWEQVQATELALQVENQLHG